MSSPPTPTRDIPPGSHLLGLSVTAGPLPAPEILAGYDHVVPGAAERLLDAGIAEMQHRRELENAEADYARRALEIDARSSALGKLCGLVGALAAIGVGCVAVVSGHESAGATIISTTAVALAGVFITGQVRQARSEDKSGEES